MTTQKIVCQLDSNGYYAGPTVADESPLEPGVWLLPAGAVDAPLPTVPEGQLAVWTGAGFALSDVPAPAQPPAQPPAKTLAERQAAVWERIKLDREARRLAGVFVGGHWFHSNDTSRIQQIGLVMMGSEIPPGLMWRTMDNGEVPMTPTLAGQIFQAVATSDAAHFEAAKILRANVEASSDPETVDTMAGWPVAYGGGA